MSVPSSTNQQCRTHFIVMKKLSEMTSWGAGFIYTALFVGDQLKCSLFHLEPGGPFVLQSNSLKGHMSADGRSRISRIQWITLVMNWSKNQHSNYRYSKTGGQFLQIRTKKTTKQSALFSGYSGKHWNWIFFNEAAISYKWTIAIIHNNLVLLD